MHLKFILFCNFSKCKSQYSNRMNENSVTVCLKIKPFPLEQWYFCTIIVRSQIIHLMNSFCKFLNVNEHVCSIFQKQETSSWQHHNPSVWQLNLGAAELYRSYILQRLCTFQNQLKMVISIFSRFARLSEWIQAREKPPRFVQRISILYSSWWPEKWLSLAFVWWFHFCSRFPAM